MIETLGLAVLSILAIMFMFSICLAMLVEIGFDPEKLIPKKWRK